jgi:hypothetical protein
MPKFRRVLLLALPGAVLMAGAGAMPVLAHNAAHFYVDGRCLEVGSDKSAPFVGQGAPQDANGQLDLIYDPKSGADVTDQYGARLAAIEGSTPLLPGDCPP